MVLSRESFWQRLDLKQRFRRSCAQWWKGPLFIVAPGQTPAWIDTAHPRVHIIDQDDLYPEDDRQFLPTFNTNSIEQWLYNTPGL